MNHNQSDFDQMWHDWFMTDAFKIEKRMMHILRLLPHDPRATIILVDPEYAYETAMVFDVPIVTGAQPEVRDDLPNPGVPAGDPEPEVIPVDPGVTSP